MITAWTGSYACYSDVIITHCICVSIKLQNYPVKMYKYYVLVEKDKKQK